MSWTDLQSIEHIKAIRDVFGIKFFAETGTCKGINIKYQAKNFKNVYSCELNNDYYNAAEIKNQSVFNCFIHHEDSSTFLKKFNPRRPEPIFFYLDAHFYNPEGKNNRKKRWVILNELKTLKGFNKCCIAIHDFDNGLGHITYDGESLNLELVKKDLFKVNPKFHLYTNELSSCRIKKLEEAEDMDELENLKYVWSKPEKTYRGILYALPRKS